MQGRRRSPVDGIRSGSAGMGRISPDGPGQGHGAYGSGYRSFGRGAKYRRGQQPKPQSYLPPPPPPPLPPPPRKTDILTEAGRLAAEYLVAKGFLPASSLPPRFVSANGSYQDLKGRETGNSSFQGRTSALDRLGNSNPDAGYGRRKYNDEYSQSGSGQQSRGRRKRAGNYSKSYGSEWGRDNGRSGSWTDRSRNSNENSADDGDDEVAPGYRRGGSDYHRGDRPSKAIVDSERPSRSEVAEESESDADNYDMGSKASSSMRKNVILETGGESNRESNDDKVTDMYTEQGMDGESAEVEEDGMEDDSSKVHDPTEVDKVSNLGNDLLKLCKFVKVPTKLRTSVASKGAKVARCPVMNDKEKRDEPSGTESGEMDEPNATETMEAGEPSTAEVWNGNEAASAAESGLLTEKDDSKSFPSDPPVETSHNSSCMALEDSADLPHRPMEESTNFIAVGKRCTRSMSFPESSSVQQLGESMRTSESKPCPRSMSFTKGSSVPHQRESVNTTESKACSRSMSFPKCSLVQQQSASVPAVLFTSDSKSSARSYSFPESSSISQLQIESNQNLPSSKTSRIMINVELENDFVPQDVKAAGTKRPRDWYSNILSQDDDCVHLGDMHAKQFQRHGESLLPDGEIPKPIDQKRFADAELFPKVEPQSDVKLEEDKQLISSSFKICDLNLMGTPEITEISDDPIQEHIPSTSPILGNLNAPSVEFGLSIGHNSQTTDVYGPCSSDGKVVQVIDLDDDDSPIEGSVCDPSKSRSEIMYPNLDNFLNNTENPVDLPDIQDGYGRAISDLLGPDITSCPSVTADMNSLQPGMNLHAAEGIPGDDDSIYVSLGEIPIGFMDIWDPPPQEYGKYF